MSYLVTNTPHASAVESDFFQFTAVSVDEAFAELEKRSLTFANNVSIDKAFFPIEENGQPVLVARTAKFSTIRITEAEND